MWVFLMGLNSVAWYQCARLEFFISNTKLFSDWCVWVRLGCGVVDSCTCHMLDSPLWVPPGTTFYLFASTHPVEGYWVSLLYSTWQLRDSISKVYSISLLSCNHICLVYWWPGPNACSSGSWFTPGFGWLTSALLPFLLPRLPCDWPALSLISLGSCWHQWD